LAIKALLESQYYLHIQSKTVKAISLGTLKKRREELLSSQSHKVPTLLVREGRPNHSNSNNEMCPTTPR